MMNKMKNKRNKRNQRPNVQNDHDQFRSGVVGDALVKKADRRIPENINIDADLLKIGRRLSDGKIEIDMPTGDYTYKGMMFMLKVAGDTALAAVGDLGAVTAAQLSKTGENGKNYVESQYFSRLITRIKLVSDGITVFDFETFQRASAYLRQNGWALNGSDVGAFIGFGWPNMFREDTNMRDLYAFGTQNVDDLKLTIYTSDEWTDDMKLEVPTLFHPVSIPAMHVQSRETYTPVFTAAGKHVFNEIRIDRRISRIILTTQTGKKIGDYEVEIGDVPFQNTNTQAGALLARLLQPTNGEQKEVGPYRTSPGDLEDGIGACIDIQFDPHREGRALAPLTSEAQRRRDDRIKITLNTLSDDTEVFVEVWFNDRL